MASRWLQRLGQLRLSRVAPIVTIAAGVITALLIQIHVIQASPVEHIIVGLLVLLGVDSLIERLGILERLQVNIDSILERLGVLKEVQLGLNSLAERSSIFRNIEDQLSRLEASPLRSRTDLPSLKSQTEGTTEILLLAVSGVSLIRGNFPIFRQRLEEGCSFKIILLDPDCPFVDNWNAIVGARSTRGEIENVLDLLDNLVATSGGNCRIKLAATSPPFSLFAVNPNSEGGRICVEFHTLATPLEDRPLVWLHRERDARWFSFFLRQFEKAWNAAKER